MLRHDDAGAADLPPGTTARRPRACGPTGSRRSSHYPRLARRVGADVIVTHNFTPWSGRSAVFVHDVMFQTNPEWFTRPERAYYCAHPAAAPAGGRRRHVVAPRGGADRRPQPAASAADGPRHRPRGRHRPARRRRRRGPTGMGVDERFVLSRRPAERAQEPGPHLRGRPWPRARSPPTRPLVVVGEPEGVRTAVEPGRARRRSTTAPSGSSAASTTAASPGCTGTPSCSCSSRSTRASGSRRVEALSFGCPVLASDIPVLRENLGTERDLRRPAGRGRHRGRAGRPGTTGPARACGRSRLAGHRAAAARRRRAAVGSAARVTSGAGRPSGTPCWPRRNRR